MDKPKPKPKVRLRLVRPKLASPASVTSAPVVAARARAPTVSSEVIGNFRLTPDSKKLGLFVSGPTIAIKDDLKQLGSRYNGYKKAWWVPPDKSLAVKNYLKRLTQLADQGATDEPAPSASKPSLSDEPAPDVKEDQFNLFKRLDALNQMVDDLEVDDVRELIDLTDEELDYLVRITQLHQKSESLTDRVQKTKVLTVLDALAGKLCRCIKSVAKSHPDGESAGIPICISKIFKKKGLKISGVQCKPTPQLKVRKGFKVVLGRQPRIQNIMA